LRVTLAAVLAGALTLAALRIARQLLGLGEDFAAGPAAVLVAAGAALIHSRLELRVQALTPALAEARLDALQSRIRPHFLFNSLNAVLALIPDDSRRAERVLEDLAELFRALLGDHRRLVPLADEIELCRRYLDIERERLGARLQVEWHLPSPLPTAWLPPLVVQPLVENAVIHGIEPAPVPAASACSTLPRPIEIRVESAGGRLLIRVSNPVCAGAGAPEGQRRGHGSGLSNVRERLALHYDLEAAVDVHAGPEAFSVTLHMPLGTPE
jgi:two-component system sensor histidine kinase AlgZ